MKSKENRVEEITTSLEIDERLSQHKTGWMVQRVGLLILYSFLTTAALGAFGDGFVSSQTLHTTNTRIEYDRFYRYQAPMQLRFDVLNRQQSLMISLPVQYAKVFEIESISPEVSACETKNGYINYRFDGRGDMHVVFYLTPQKIGSLHADIRVNDETFSFHQLIYP